ncbi:MAG: hypothetical protein U1A22_01195 [Xanthomonadaceae bacterium]|nr:hypothetical protein [Xanthomonadaceae bacterium]
MNVSIKHAAGLAAIVSIFAAVTPSLAEAQALEPGNLIVANFQAFPGFGDSVGTVIQFDLSGRGLGNIKKIGSEIGDPDAELFDGNVLPAIPWGPGGMAVGGPNRDLYVASILRGTITRFDQRTSAAAESLQIVPIPGPEAGLFGLRGMVWGPNGNLFVSVCAADGNSLDAVDAVFELDRLTLDRVREIRQAGTPTTDCFGGIGFGPDDLLYVSGLFSGNVAAFDLSTAVAVDGDSTVVEVETVRDIFMLEAGEAVVDTLAALSFAPDGTLFVSVGQNGDPSVDARIAVVAPGASMPTRTIPAGQPTGIRWAVDGNLYVGDLAARAVLVIDPETGDIVRRIENGRKGLSALDPRFVIFNPAPFQ